MFKIVARRLAVLPLIAFGVAVLIFAIGQVIPNDPVRLIAGEGAPQEVRDNISRDLGLDQPIHEQFLIYLSRIAQGDLGESTRFSAPVSELLWQALPTTLSVVAGTVLVTLLLVFPMGFAAARFRNTPIDVGVRSIAMLGIATPSFYLALIMILVFGYHLEWFPISGRGDPPDLWHLVLPSLVLGIRDAGSSARLLRAGLLDAMSDDYIVAARSRGLSDRLILFKLAGRNALIPAITDMALRFAGLGGQIIVIEAVFGLPGIGNLLHSAILWNDFPLLAGSITFLLAYVVLVNLIVDLVQRWADPRLRVDS